MIAQPGRTDPRAWLMVALLVAALYLFARAGGLAPKAPPPGFVVNGDGVAEYQARGYADGPDAARPPARTARVSR